MRGCIKTDIKEIASRIWHRAGSSWRTLMDSVKNLRFS